MSGALASSSAALTPAESDHGGGGVPSLGPVGSGPWPDPNLGINWMHCWAPVNLLDSDMLDFELGMPFMGFEGGDHLGSRPPG